MQVRPEASTHICCCDVPTLPNTCTQACRLLLRTADGSLLGCQLHHSLDHATHVALGERLLQEVLLLFVAPSYTCYTLNPHSSLISTKHCQTHPANHRNQTSPFTPSPVSTCVCRCVIQVPS